VVSYTDKWRPYPVGFSQYGVNTARMEKPGETSHTTLRGGKNAALLAHFGYRGPRFFQHRKAGTRMITELDRWFGECPMIGGKCELFSLSRKGWNEGRLNRYRNKKRAKPGL